MTLSFVDKVKIVIDQHIEQRVTERLEEMPVFVSIQDHGIDITEVLKYKADIIPTGINITIQFDDIVAQLSTAAQNYETMTGWELKI